MSVSLTTFPATTQSASTPVLKVIGTKKRAANLDMAPERASKKRQRTDPNDEDTKKQRGRPRVDGQDETAADRRRTQIRLAQRAYRQRKETTISNLNEQVATLRATVEQMENIFLAFNDKAMASGQLHKTPELAKELKSATEAFIQLAKTNGSDDEHSDSELEEIPRKPHGSYQEDIAMILQGGANSNTMTASPEPQLAAQGNEFVPLPLGYRRVFDDNSQSTSGSNSNGFASPVHVSNQNSGISMPFSNYTFSGATGNTNPLAVAPIPTSFSSKNQPIIALSAGDRADMLTVKTLSAPYTYSFEETTFARRLQRAALERGFHLLTNSDMRPSAFLFTFRLSLLYHTRDTLLMKFRRALNRSTEEPLETYQTPFIHLGGAGMHYNTGRIRNGYTVKPGPLQRQAILESTETSGAVVDIELDLSEYEGEWFDSNDVEGYLSEKGLRIDPQSSFAEGAIVLPTSFAQSLSTHSSPPANIFDSPNVSNADMDLASLNTPPTPLVSDIVAFPELGAESPNTLWNMAANDWLMGSGDKTPDFLSSGWTNAMPPAEWDMTDAMGYDASNLMHNAATAPVLVEEKKQVTLDVSKFIDELIRTGICLGRAPGFRKKDVDRALSAAILQVY